MSTEQLLREEAITLHERVVALECAEAHKDAIIARQAARIVELTNACLMLDAEKASVRGTLETA